MAEALKKQRRTSSRRDKLARKADSASLSKRRQQKETMALVSGSGCDEIHKAVLNVLWDLGVFVDHKETRDWLITEHGCREGEHGFLRVPPDLVEKALSSVPLSIKLYDQNGDVRVDTAGPVSYFAPGHNCVNVLDHQTNELRPCVLEDIRKTAIVCENLSNIDMVSGLGYPGDVPPEDESYETVRTMMENSIKPAKILAHDEDIQKRVWDYAAGVTGGWPQLVDRPIAIELMGPVSPLRLPEDFCLRLINCAKWRLPVACYPATFPGMSCPISVAGAIVQSSAESIAGIVIHQLVEPGAPILSGASILPMDMRQANLAYGSPEYMLAGLGAANYFDSRGIPAWVGAGCSDSHCFDGQAAAEAGSTLSIATLAKTKFVHNLGFLTGGRTGSIEMLTLCDEIVGWSNQMAAGIKLDPESLGVEVIKRAAADNSYLTDDHTQNRFLTENWYPSLFERSDAEAWASAGGLDLKDRVRQRLGDILG